MRSQANTKKAAFLLPWILLAATTGSVITAGPHDGASAKACLRLDSQTAVPGMFGCMRFVVLRNSCDAHVVVDVRTTQHLFSGTLRQVFPVIVPAGGEQSLGCAWWGGATASSNHELLAARFFAVPTRPGPRGPHCSNQH